jgi:hypothetical protein
VADQLRAELRRGQRASRATSAKFWAVFLYVITSRGRTIPPGRCWHLALSARGNCSGNFKNIAWSLCLLAVAAAAAAGVMKFLI